jgi:uncharacterized protein (DUF1684 family)
MPHWAYLFLATAPILVAAGYESEIAAWRAERESKLKADAGWLTVAGLFWLKPGRNTFGSASSNDIVLPDGPAQAGAFEMHAGQVTAALAGQPPRPLKHDSEAPADVVIIKDLTLFVIQRGDRYGIRLRDKNSSFRREFSTLHWFPVKESARVTARFVSTREKITIPNILGQKEEETSPGYAVFQWAGHEQRLYPTKEDDRLFFVFRDLTAGKETYPAGRFLYADMPRDGSVVLDFNKAYNPPCAFTPYATCPLPPPQNRMRVRIDAGELNYGPH